MKNIQYFHEKEKFNFFKLPNVRSHSLKCHCIPLAIVKHNKHASGVIFKHFIAVTISIADDEVKNASVNDV